MMARDQCRLVVRQEPQRAQVVQENNPKNRKPIDPPPIIELKYDDRNDPSNSQWLVSPRTFMMVTLVDAKDTGEKDVLSQHPNGRDLIGQTVSSLHRLKDINNKDGGFFVFGDISARKLGTFRLKFSLFDTVKEQNECVFMGSCESNPFQVVPQRDFGSMSESTHLTRTFSDQGVKLRVRKDNRAISAVGTKRNYQESRYSNVSPPDTTSPGMHSNLYGGAVQDHLYGPSTQSPPVKRQRAGSEYEVSHLYQAPPYGDSHLSHYSNPLPSSTRAWTGNETHRLQAGYHQQQSPIRMSGSSRMQQPVDVQQAQTPPGWSNINPQSALPSPALSVSNQAPPSYPAVTSQQQSSLFGDPGAASAIPRNAYYNSYQYQTHGQYQPQQSEVNNTYNELQMPGSSMPDASLASAQSHGYNSQGLLPSGSLYSTEAADTPGGYSYIGPDQRY